MLTAFSARLTREIAAPSVGTTLVFGTETLDLGDGYDPSTGIYTVQQNGTYTFTWSLTVYNGYITTALMINSSPKQYLQSVYASGTGVISSTSTVVTEVNVGDRVYIKLTYKSVGSPYIVDSFSADGYSSTFGGWMLQ